jgi:alpha-amylase
MIFSYKRLLPLFLCIFSFAALISSKPLEKRSTQVALNSYTFTNGVLAGSINVSNFFRHKSIICRFANSFFQIQNIAYTKVVSIYYAVGSTWTTSPIAASYSAAAASGYETWVFSGTATGATQFYIEYDVSGSSSVIFQHLAF